MRYMRRRAGPLDALHPLDPPSRCTWQASEAPFPRVSRRFCLQRRSPASLIRHFAACSYAPHVTHATGACEYRIHLHVSTRADLFHSCKPFAHVHVTSPIAALGPSLRFSFTLPIANTGLSPSRLLLRIFLFLFAVLQHSLLPGPHLSRHTSGISVVIC